MAVEHNALFEVEGEPEEGELFGVGKDGQAQALVLPKVLVIEAFVRFLQTEFEWVVRHLGFGEFLTSFP